MLSECLNCGCSWGVGSEEYEWQQCDACGWEPGDATDEDLECDDAFEDEETDGFLGDNGS